ncbi:MAG: FAD-dependent oxidoreductase, partial [SAR202 cluster bacterium]|nr:FAD-dependent oxidoreductase [SAR202 cluster bacterium]
SETEDDSQEYADTLIRRAALYFDQLSGVEAIRVPVGFRPMPEDGLPVIGFSPRHTNIYLTLTHSGVTLAPLVGALAALEMVTEIPNNDLDPYRPARFAFKG